MKKSVFFRLFGVIDKELFLKFKMFLKITEKNRPEIEYVFLWFNSEGGELGYASKIIDLMNKSKLKFLGVAYDKVHSSAIPIFLSTQARFGYSNASALVHRVKRKNNNLSNKQLKVAEKQVFKLIAKKLCVRISQIENMADYKNGEGTYITMEHFLGKKFFFGGGNDS